MTLPDPPATPWPGEAWLAALARDTLLDHLDRGDVRHALQRALDGLSTRLHAAVTLVALTDDATVSWSVGPAVELPLEGGALTRGAGCAVDAGWAAPLWALGRRVGVLVLHGTQDPSTAERLDPLLPTLAGLLLRSQQHGQATASNEVAVIRAALAGAETFVWEWDIDSDWLGDIDEGYRLLGYNPATMGHSQDDWNRLIHPDDLDANHEAYLRHARGESKSYEHVYRIKAHDGGWRWYLERGAIVEWHPDGRPRRMAGIQSDLSERKRIEADAADALARLERIAEHVPGVLYQYALPPRQGGKGHFRFVSKRAEQWLGEPAARILEDPMRLFDAIDPLHLPALWDSFRRSAAGTAEWRQEFRMRRADGTWRWILGRSTPQREADGTLLWHGYLEDMTERRELEHARHEAAVAEAANRAKTEFLSRISHELRTPLNAVLGFTQLLEMDPAEPPTDGQRRRLKLVRDAGDHLLRMIGDLLDLTRIEAGSLPLVLESVALQPLLQDTLAMLQEAAGTMQVQFDAEGTGAGLYVRADRTRLRQVLLNLIGNAIKYNRIGGCVALAARVEGGSVVVEVRDTGHGIAERDRSQLFTPFHRGGHAHGRIEGSGIGLSLTRSLAMLMQGQVELGESTPQGSMFRLTLPTT